MTAMDAVKSRVNNKKGKPWVYFFKAGKKSKSIQKPAASTKPSGTDDTTLPHRPSNDNSNKRKRKRKRKLPKPPGNSVMTNEDKLKSEKEGSSASNVTSKDTTKKDPQRTDDAAGHDNADNSTSNASKTKQQKKKIKRKLKILKRKEKENKAKGSSDVTSSSQVTSVTNSTISKSKKTLIDRAKSCKASGAANVKKLDGEASIDEKLRTASDVNQGGDEKCLSRKRKLKGELDTKEKKKRKKQKASDALDSGMSSGTETPHLPEEPEDVASNWKALVSKLKASAPKKPKLKTKNRNDEDVDKKENEIWFDDVDPALLEAEKSSSEHHNSESAGAYTGNNKITKCVALDCEMVGTGHEGKESILARVSMVNEYGQCIYDKFVKPREKVTDFRTEFSGVRPKDLFKGNAEEFLTVQKEVSDIMKDRLLVGHALKNDMQVLYLGHPRRLLRDTASYPHFRELMKTRRPALKKLAKTVLGVTVQEGEHNSVEDAQTAMRLYTLHRTAWEKSIKQRGKKTEGK